MATPLFAKTISLEDAETALMVSIIIGAIIVHPLVNFS